MKNAKIIKIIKIAVVVLLIICVVIHLPRLCIEYYSRYSDTTPSSSVDDDDEYHGEDAYQKERSSTEDINNRVISWIHFDISPKQWNRYLNYLVPALIKFYRSELGEQLKNLKDRDIIKYTDSSTFSLVGDEHCVGNWINNDTQIIRCSYDHRYCSGHFFLKCGTVFFDGEHSDVSIFSHAPFLAEIAISKLVYYKPYNQEGKCFKMIKDTKDIRRIFMKIKLDHRKISCDREDDRCVINWVAWIILRRISKASHRSKTLNVIIPVAFDKLPNISNNIGITFIKWLKSNISFEDFSELMNGEKYQTMATNLYMRGNSGSNYGKDVRNDTDVVLTIGYVKDAKYHPSYQMTSFNSIPDYPVYCMAVIIHNVVHVSISVYTKDINVKTLLNNPETTLLNI